MGYYFDTAKELFLEGTIALEKGDLDLAELKLTECLRLIPDRESTKHNLAILFTLRADALSEKKKYDEAIAFYSKALDFDENYAVAWSNKGVILDNHFNVIDEAIFCFEKALQLMPGYSDAHLNLGAAHEKNKKYSKALEHYELALQYNPNCVEAWINRGNALNYLKRHEEALTSFNQAIKLQPNLSEAWGFQSNALNELKRHEEALASADEAIKLKPHFPEAWNNRGVALNDLKRHEESLASYDRVIELTTDRAEAWSNRGITLNNLKRHEEALASYETSIKLKPDYAEAWGNRGVALDGLKRYEEALASYERAIELNPDIDFMLGDLMHSQMKTCKWDSLEQRCQTLKNRLLSGRRASLPFPALGLFDNPELQKRCAEIYAQDTLSLGGYLGVLAQRPKREKIRVGYFSMDFREHPVSYLIADLIELHNRNKFEIYGFSFGVHARDAIRERLEKAFDKFYDVKHLSGLGIARLSRQCEIDIAIDLGGYTRDSRPQIFSVRAAPIQINYLGYLGTWGSDCMDYFIGDKVTVSDENREHFSERIIFLPNCFQVNPSYRPIANDNLSREICGLPHESFVFCCFNNSWKIGPEVFEQWMRILQRAPCSVLWLCADNLSAEKNLRSEAVKHGVLVDRVIFTKRVQRDVYLAQFQHADLFLDTLPYNAGTIASDALWAGLPVLTRIGKSFPGRMAASLVTHIQIPELITHSKEEYCSLAIELASNPQRLAAIKAKLTQNRFTTPLFDTKLFTGHIESAYQAAYDRYHSGLPADHIYVGP